MIRCGREPRSCDCSSSREHESKGSSPPRSRTLRPPGRRRPSRSRGGSTRLESRWRRSRRHPSLWAPPGSGPPGFRLRRNPGRTRPSRKSRSSHGRGRSEWRRLREGGSTLAVGLPGCTFRRTASKGRSRDRSREEDNIEGKPNGEGDASSRYRRHPHAVQTRPGSCNPLPSLLRRPRTAHCSRIVLEPYAASRPRRITLRTASHGTPPLG
jgi:hypothetical protein